MTPSQERKTLARLSVAAGSSMTLAAAWLGVLEVEQPAALPDGAEASLAASREAISPALPAPTGLSTSTATVPAPTPGIASVTATPPAATVTPAATVPAPATAVPTSPPGAAVTPATAPAPVPTPRIVTRRSRAS